MPAKRDRIAWIEEEPDLQVLEYLTEDLGFDVERYRSYTEAVDNLKRIQTADVVLLDVILRRGPRGPKEKEDGVGMHLLRLMRERTGMQPPVIVYSMVYDARRLVDPAELRTLNAVAVGKDFQLDDLRQHISRALRRDVTPFKSPD